MVFSIVIPAYNEELAVQDILRRCLKAVPGLLGSVPGLSEVEIILVDDGSRDRTAALAREVEGVRVVSHPVNRGYGAAIKTGFEAAKGDWLAFLDADGTCDPEFFRELLSLARKDELDVALGSRMHPSSRMPAVRVLGNWLFRTLVNLIGGTDVTDVASGMRVVRRTALERLYPLPDGMHFTPAMSVRALLDPALRIGETPMPYEERVGRSKLSAVGDGLRFLRIILETSLTYRPLKFCAGAACGLSALAAVLLVFRLGAPTPAPVPFYFSHGRVEDWMFFRLMLTSVLLATAAFLVALGLVAQSLVDLIHRGEDRFRPGAGPAGMLMNNFALWGLLGLLAAVWVDRRPLIAYLSTGAIPQGFWVFPVVGALFALVGIEFLAFSVMARIARLLWEKELWRRSTGR